MLFQLMHIPPCDHHFKTSLTAIFVANVHKIRNARSVVALQLSHTSQQRIHAGPQRAVKSCRTRPWSQAVLKTRGNLRKGGRCFQDFSGSTASISHIPHQRPQIGRICIYGSRNRRLSIVQEAQRLFHMVKHSLMAAWKQFPFIFRIPEMRIPLMCIRV